jgi:TonB family protein
VIFFTTLLALTACSTKSNGKRDNNKDATQLAGANTAQPTLTDALSPEGVDTKPKAEYIGKPDYPIIMRKAGVGGRVFVRFGITKKGEVVLPHIYRSEIPTYERVALEEIKKKKFLPDNKKGIFLNERNVKTCEFIYDGMETCRVWVEFSINEKGDVLSPRVIGSKCPLFEQAAVRAVRQSQFLPATKNGVPVDVKDVILPIVFSLDVSS